MSFRFPILFLISCLLALALAACRGTQIHQVGSGLVNNAHPHAEAAEPEAGREKERSSVLDLSASRDLQAILPRLAEQRVVYVGETHDKYSHHLTQLEIIADLYERNPGIAIGMEAFQQPYQPTLDDYIGGRLDEREMLARTEWFDRWIYDYRLYRPILAFAREKGIPVVALNVPMELTARVSEAGLEGLEPEERAALPAEIDVSDQAYRERLRVIFAKHQPSSSRDFERFMQVQLTWDEGMAERVADYLRENPERSMIVLAGSGHLMYGSGIPQRVTRRLPVAAAIVLPGDDLRIRPEIADFLVYPTPRQLPEAGLMGVMLESAEQGVSIASVVPDSAADRAGMEKGDLIQSLDGVPMTSTADIKIGMLDKQPGDRVRLKLLRKRLLGQDRQVDLEFELGGI